MCDVLDVNHGVVKTFRLVIGSALELNMPFTGFSLSGKVARLTIKGRAGSLSVNSTVNDSGISVSGNTVAVLLLPGTEFRKIQSGSTEWIVDILDNLETNTILKQISGRIVWK